MPYYCYARQDRKESARADFREAGRDLLETAGASRLDARFARAADSGSSISGRPPVCVAGLNRILQEKEFGI